MIGGAQPSRLWTHLAAAAMGAVAAVPTTIAVAHVGARSTLPAVGIVGTATWHFPACTPPTKPCLRPIAAPPATPRTHPRHH